MGGIVKSIFGGSDGSAKAAVRVNQQTNKQISENTDKQIAALQASKLFSGGGLSTSFLSGATVPTTTGFGFGRFGNFGSFPSLASGPGTLSLKADSNRTGLVNSLSNILSRTSGRFGDLGSLVKPGFSEFRNVGLNSLRDQRRRVVGDLKDNLARRRIAGSSFASDAVSRAEAEFQKREDEFSTQTFLQEIESSARLIEQESQFASASVETKLAELNIEADAALKLTGIANAGISQISSSLTAGLTALSTSSAGLLQRAGQNATELQASLLGFGLGKAFPG